MELLIIFILILLNGFFAMSEIALISARKTRLENAAKKGNKAAQIALDLANSHNKLLSTTQIGITVITLLTGVFSGDKITESVYEFVNQFVALQPYAQSIAVAIVLVILTFFSLVFGELLPKRIGLNHPESIAKSVAVPMKMVSTIASPFIWLLTHSTDFLLKILNIKPSADGKVTEEEIKAIIKEGTDYGEVQEIEQDIVERVFHIGDRKVNSLMTHRNSVIFIPLNSTKQQVKELMLKELHSVYPVFGDNFNEIVGVVNLKNIFSNIDNENFNLKDILTEAPYLMEQTTAYTALENFKKSGIHYAFVSDEYGDFQGIITLNDILEALVGDASEFYKDDFQLTEREDGSWLVDGHYSLHDFLTYFELDELINDYEVTTVSGLIMTELAHIPKQGEKLIWQKYELEVMDMDGVKIDKVLVKSLKV
jgi:putative hemolysin